MLMHTLQTDILGPVRVFPFSSSKPGEGDAVAIVAGTPETVPKTAPAPLVRLHSRCLYGEFLKSRDCDCLAQYEETLRLILDERVGIIFYLEQEGRGRGLMDKARAYQYMERYRKDTVEAYTDLNYEVDPRGYSHVSHFLRELGIDRVRLITNNPRKVEALESDGIHVERIPVVVGINHWNIHYIEAKKNKLGHMIDLEISE
jgi:GTP cyclohydrolase II